MVLTKPDLSAIRDVIREETVPLRQDFEDFRNVMHVELRDIREDINALREQIQQLTITLDHFLKRLTNYEEEFMILRAQVDQIKAVLKEKLGVEISVPIIGWLR